MRVLGSKARLRSRAGSEHAGRRPRAAATRRRARASRPRRGNAGVTRISHAVARNQRHRCGNCARALAASRALCIELGARFRLSFPSEHRYNYVAATRRLRGSAAVQPNRRNRRPLSNERPLVVAEGADRAATPCLKFLPCPRKIQSFSPDKRSASLWVPAFAGTAGKIGIARQWSIRRGERRAPAARPTKIVSDKRKIRCVRPRGTTALRRQRRKSADRGGARPRQRKQQVISVVGAASNVRNSSRSSIHS
jgi:hypothetical protein